MNPYRPASFSPVSSLRGVPDFATSFHPNPLRNRTIFLLFLGQESLDSESCEKTWQEAKSGIVHMMSEERRKVKTNI